MELTGAQILLESLKKEGVDVLFGYPGGAVIDIYDELPRHPELKHVLVRHEQGAVHAADGYAPECWIWAEGYTHPEENVTTAIRDSCNYFFYTIGNDLGVDDMGEFAHNHSLL